MNVYLYVLNTLADWEIGYLTAELFSRRYFRKSAPDVNLITVGHTLEAIKTMGGMAIKPVERLEAVHFAPDDLLLLPGADTWLGEETEPALQIAANLIDQGINVAAICGATIGLAKIGALNSKIHTSNSKIYLTSVCPAYTGEANYQEKPAVRDANLITASGLAPLEFTCEVLKQLDVFKKETLEAWFALYATREAAHFYALMASLEEQA